MYFLATNNLRCSTEDVCLFFLAELNLRLMTLYTVVLLLEFLLETGLRYGTIFRAWAYCFHYITQEWRRLLVIAFFFLFITLSPSRNGFCKL